MPVLAQAPTSGPNVEVTSSGKNGIVSVENLNTVETLVSCSPTQNTGLRRTFLPTKTDTKVLQLGMPLKYHRMEEVTILCMK